LKTEQNIKIEQLSKQVGNTPLIYFDSLSTPKVKIYAKMEYYQIGQSVKARAAFNIFKAAISSGSLNNKGLLDASSGNTAIAYAAIGAKLGVPVTICLPKNASQKRKDILKALGAEIILTSEFEGTDGAQLVAADLFEKNPDKYFYADQYGNDANWQAHYYGTAEEIWNQTKGDITHFVTGLGTTGSFVGSSRKLKELNPSIHTTALQPDSPMHFLEGWKHLETAKVPAIYTEMNLDQHLGIDSSEALNMISFISKKEGLLLSPSSCANLLGAQKVASQTEEGVIVTILPDDLQKYDEILKMLK
jgi:S-sulfo-L-cysteine synthase (O-acetyl-L-serine-dependent)